jgi:hypothetical protein
MKRYCVPDGYFPNGKSRPKREVLIVSKGDTSSLIEYVDNGMRLYVSNKSIEEKKNG